MAVVLWSIGLATLVFTFSTEHLRDHRFVADAEDEIQATWLAYGGIHKGLQKLSQNPQFQGILEPETLNGGEIRVQIVMKNGKMQICSEGVFHKVVMKAVKEIPVSETHHF